MVCMRLKPCRQLLAQRDAKLYPQTMTNTPSVRFGAAFHRGPAKLQQVFGATAMPHWEVAADVASGQLPFAFSCPTGPHAP